MEATVNIRKQEHRMPDGRTVAEHLHDMELLSGVGIYEVDLSERLDEPVPVATLDGQLLCSEGNLSAIVGEAKSKKTFLCSALVGGLLSGGGFMGFDPQPVRVLWIDTEQSESHVHRVVRRTHLIAGLDPDRSDDRLHVLALRELEPRLRAQTAFDAIELYRPELVVIDGISDLQYNTNDLEESER
ncbi:MAG: AAA family ATPase, partial [Alistipes sp.]|nr:AAA family ATPase [Alistipes sp.]